MRPHIINKETHGIAGWYIDKSVCIDLIKYFENSPNKGLGLLYLKSGGRGVDKKRKLSTDVPISLDNRDKLLKPIKRNINIVIISNPPGL